MQFVNTIPQNGVRRFHESSFMRSPRDSDAIGKAWRKNMENALQIAANLNGSSTLTQQMFKLRPRGLVQDVCFPFRIFPVPPDLCVDETTAGRTFQVVSGYASFRPKWVSYSRDNFPGLFGNYEVIFPITRGASRVLNPDFGLFLPSQAAESVTVGNTGEFGASANNSAEFVLNSDLDSFDERNAMFFVRFTDSDDEDTDPVAEIICQMFTFDPFDPTGRTNFGFPTDPGIVPIGAVFFDAAGNLGANGVQQWTYNHVINRYGPPPGNLTTSSIGPMFYRGNWDDD